MKQLKVILMTMLAVGLFAACSSDDDSELSDVERSLVGYWHEVEHYESSVQKPVESIHVLEFRPDRKCISYRNGQEESTSQFWTKPTKDGNSYYLYNNPDKEFYMTLTKSFEIVGNKLTIWNVGCFSSSKYVYRRITGIVGVNPVVVQSTEIINK